MWNFLGGAKGFSLPAHHPITQAPVFPDNMFRKWIQERTYTTDKVQCVQLCTIGTNSRYPQSSKRNVVFIIKKKVY